MRKAFFQLHIAIFLAGFTGILGRLITLNEGLLVWYRVLFSSMVLLFITFIQPSRFKLSFKDWIQISAVGAITALHWVFFYASIKYANVSIGLVCFSAVGFFTAVLNPLIARQRINSLDVFLGLVVMAGIYLIFHFDGEYRTGIILGIISSLLAALFTILNKFLLRRFDAATLTTYEMSGGWLVLSLLLPFYLYRFPPDHFLPTLSDFLWLLVLSLLCTVLAFNLALQALKKISPFTVNISYNLEPVYGILLAFVIYSENKYLGTGFYLGFAIILGTVILQSWRVWKMRRVKETNPVLKSR